MNKTDILDCISKKFIIESSMLEDDTLKAYFNDGNNRFFVSIKQK